MSEHAAVASASLDLDVAVVTPPGAPAVLDQPVVAASLIAVADDGDCMVVAVAGVKTMSLAFQPGVK